MTGNSSWRRWLPALLAVTAVIVLSSVLTASTVDLCDQTGVGSLLDVLLVPVVVFIGFLFALFVLLFFDTVPLAITVIGLFVLLGLTAVIALSAIRALRGDAQGRWPAIPTAIFLVTTAVLSAISTASACITATI